MLPHLEISTTLKQEMFYIYQLQKLTIIVFFLHLSLHIIFGSILLLNIYKFILLTQLKARMKLYFHGPSIKIFQGLLLVTIKLMPLNIYWVTVKN